jgi:hypothetical protein
MDIGMLWKDDDGRRSLQEKVARAVDYYQQKYGEQPTVCVIHPHMLPDGVEATAGVRLLTAKTVQINHFWLGVENGAPVVQRSRTSRRAVPA